MEPDELIGKPHEEAMQICKDNNIVFRTRKVDGESRIGTADLKPERFNFYIENGVVVDVKLG